MPVIFQQATSNVTAAPVQVHVGGSGTLSLTVANTASAGANSEALIASAKSLTGGFSLGGFTTLSNAAGTGGTVITGINDAGTVIGYYLSPSTGTGTANQNAATAGTQLPTSFTWTSAAGYTTIASVAPETGTYGNGSTIPPGPDAPNGYAYIASGISGGSAVSYFGAGANPVFNGTIVLGTAVDYTNTATGNPVYNGPATVDSAQARFSGSTAYATFTTPAYLSATFLAPNGYYNGPGISQNGSYASLTKVLNTGSVEAVGDYGTALVAFDSLATLVGATNSYATGVNDSHVYVGTYQNSTGYHGFTGTVNATGTFVFGASFDIAGATNTYLMGIDNNGDFAGYFTDAGGRKHGFADVNGVVSTIDIGTGTTVVTGINDSGIVTGYTVATGSSIDVGFVGSVPQTAPIAAGASSNTLQLAFSTAQAGTITGTATLGLTSDGNVVSGNTLGLTTLGTTSLALTAVVNNYATAALQETAPSTSTITQTGTLATVNLGTVLVGNTSAVVTLKALNAASGASDVLSGSFVVNGGTGFTNTGLAAFTGLAAGQADSAPTVTLNTGTIGTFTETITLQSTGSNSSGYSGALANQVVTITGTVVAAGSNTTQGAVSIPTSSSATLAKAQSVITGVSSAIAAGAVATISSPSFSSALTSPSTPTVLQVGGGNPVALGAVNLGTLNANVTAVLINNTGSTTAANTSASAQQSVVGGTGGLSFTDAGTGTQLVVGGGTNSVNFAATSTGASFTGDGLNTLSIAATSGTTTIIGTGASADTIRATSTGSVNYTAASGSTAVVSATSGNVTIIGTAGAAQTVFGGSGTTIISDGNGGTKTFTQAAFTGKLAATNVQGYAEGGTAGANTLSGGSTGSSTLVGGGAGDTLVAGGAGDQLVARARGGNTTLDGSQTAGGINLWADVNSTNTNAGAVTMYGSRSVADNFYLSTSTVTGSTGGTTFKGSLITLHTSSTGTVMNSVAAGTIVNNTIDVDVFNSLAQFATVTDFVSGHDRLVIGSGQGAVTIAQSDSGFVVSTAQGSTITLAGTIALGDISRI